MTDDLSRRLVELERELADVRAQLEEISEPEPLSSRRNLFRVATAAAVGAAGPASPHAARQRTPGDELTPRRGEHRRRA